MARRMIWANIVWHKKVLNLEFRRRPQVLNLKIEKYWTSRLLNASEWKTDILFLGKSVHAILLLGEDRPLALLQTSRMVQVQGVA